MLSETLQQYIEVEILPRYDGFDAAHRRDHAEMVIRQSMEIARRLTENGRAKVFGEELNFEMIYAIAAYHDTGLSRDRKTHHLVSGEIVRADERLREWFSAEEIETMARAVEDHRASSDHEPRSIYGKIVAEADRFIEPEKIIERTVQYGLEHYPELDREGQWQRMLQHMQEKYGEGGYLRLWFPESPNVQRLEALRVIIRDEVLLRSKFEVIFDRIAVEHHPLKPFLPENCCVLFLGSFPPQRKRWCIDFFYPNWINDHWRIEGLVWFGDKNRFVDEVRKTFKLNEIKVFLCEKGIGFYDTATAVRRLADNASDRFLEIVEPTDIATLIAPLRELKAIAVTGEKASETLCTYYKIKEMPKTGTFILLPNGLRLYRLPSSSRAYPLSLDRKAEPYRRMFEDLGMI